eukprot:gnl/MRDRNA2_/MRDRNA2_36170_c0_seq1.p1 gnl/MRDRNA2_/MRDRNA2_36170_c0~~gnl/MRDRNA2_/MRDRNA2_36170_c0_seq1.p1  ORF type:complete len:171 (+),score=30.25 gnl/MRDRNA2_/MRDRNA2_36170_c0_seq1:34-513(+)
MAAEGSWAASIYAQREVHSFETHQTRQMIAWALSGRNFTADGEPVAGNSAVTLARIVTRPGAGAAYASVHACSAELWYRLAAKGQVAMAALQVGIITQYGLCAGHMKLSGLKEAIRWYHVAINNEASDDYRILAQRALWSANVAFQNADMYQNIQSGSS